MIIIAIIVALTISVSAFCSALEAMVLSTTPIEIDKLKRSAPARGKLLEKLVGELDKTISAVLSMNTVANTFGATLAGVQCANIYGSTFSTKYVFPAFLTISILLFAEILPKNICILYRPALQKHFVYPLYIIRLLMSPISRFCSMIINLIAPRKTAQKVSDDEILFLARKGEQDGLLSVHEKKLIENALSLDDITIAEIMTPRTVLLAFDETETVSEAFRKNLPFSRIPVYRENPDNITGIVRRREILTAMANDKHDTKLSEISTPPIFVPENGSALSVLRQLIKNHQQMGIVVDEFTSLTGVVTLEDIFENLLGSEIFEKDDIAVDMRELALKRLKNKKSKKIHEK